MEISIKQGGNLGRLVGKLDNVRVFSSDSKDSKCIQLWIHSVDSEERTHESLTYLSIEEAMELSKALNSSIKETIEQYTK